MSVSSSSAPVFVAEAKLQERESVMGAWAGSLAALLIAELVTLFLFRQTVVSMVTIWAVSRTYSYGFIIVPICAVLVWRRKEDLKYLQPSASIAGLLLFLVSALLWMAGNVADVQLIQHAALVGMVDALVWAFLGGVIVRVLLFPLVFLFFAVPAGNGLVPWLQSWTASFTVAALRVSGIPAVQDGLALSTPSGDWQVAEACSGIRYLLASIMIGTLVAGVAYRSWKRRVAFLLFSALLPIVANAIRAYGIVALAYLSGNSIAAGVDHVVYGFLFFSILTAALLAVALRWYEPLEAPKSARRPSDKPPVGRTKLVLMLTGTIVIAASASAGAEYLWSRTAVIPAAANSLVPPAGWVATRDLDNEWAPEPGSMRSRTIETFTSGSADVSICFVTYPAERRGVELINSSNMMGKSGVWTLLASNTRDIAMADGPVQVSEYSVAHGTQRRLVWSWYLIGDQRTSDPYRVRVLEAANRLLGRPQSTAFVAVSTPYQSDPSTARTVLADFVK